MIYTFSPHRGGDIFLDKYLIAAALTTLMNSLCYDRILGRRCERRNRHVTLISSISSFSHPAHWPMRRGKVTTKATRLQQWPRLLLHTPRMERRGVMALSSSAFPGSKHRRGRCYPAQLPICPQKIFNLQPQSPGTRLTTSRDVITSRLGSPQSGGALRTGFACPIPSPGRRDWEPPQEKEQAVQSHQHTLLWGKPGSDCLVLLVTQGHQFQLVPEGGDGCHCPFLLL